MEVLTRLQMMESNHLVVAVLIVTGLFYSLRQVTARLFGRSKQQPLFPQISRKSEALVGAQICSTHEPMVYQPKLEENGEINWNLSYDYYAPPPVQMPISAHPSALGHALQPVPQLPAAPAGSHAAISHAPVRRAAIPVQRNAPYYRNQPNCQKTIPDVQIISPSYYQWDPVEQQATPQYEYLEMGLDASQLQPVPEMPPAHMHVEPVGVPPMGAPMTMPEQIYEPALDYSLVNDVWDVVYDDGSSFVPTNVSPLEPVSYSSSDHSDHEYLSPPYAHSTATNPSPRSLEDESSNLSDTPSFDSSSERFVCPHCNADFRIKGYLTRHLKKHARQKAYTCPFFHPDSGQKCHPTGGFSRRDTYKTHLKARHFIYPQNTPCSERANVVGTCSGCNQEFASNEAWVETHIQTRMCRALD